MNNQISSLKSELEKERASVLSMQKAAKLEETEKAKKAGQMEKDKKEIQALKARKVFPA